MNPTDLQTAVGAAYGTFTIPNANLCTAQDDENMYCLNDLGEKRYCHCEPVSSNYHFSEVASHFFYLLLREMGVHLTFDI